MTASSASNLSLGSVAIAAPPSGRSIIIQQNKPGKTFTARPTQQASTEQNPVKAIWEAVFPDSISLFTAALFLATIALWLATLKIAREGRKSADIQADKMERSVVEAANAAKAIKRQNEIAEDTAKRQLRAYVGFPSMHLIDRHQNDPRFSVEVKNFGQTPANNVTIHSVIDARPKGSPRPPFNMMHEFGTLEPDRVQIYVAGFGSENLINHAAQLATGEINIHLSGMLTYFDIYGRYYFKEFTAYVSHRRLNNQGPIGTSTFVAEEEEGEPPANGEE
jgi:hypothetical protein